jgi:hypothetical protein
MLFEDGHYPCKGGFEVMQWFWNSLTLFCHRQPFNVPSQFLHRHHAEMPRSRFQWVCGPPDRFKVALLQTYPHRFESLWSVFEKESKNTPGQWYTT